MNTSAKLPARLSKLALSGALLAVLAASCLTGCSGASGQGSSGPLKVGMELAYPPFETKDAAGNPSGVSVDFAKALGDYLGRSVEISNISWDGLIPALQTGQVDAVISSMTITADRQTQIDFSKPYAKALLALLTNKNSGITQASDLNQAGKTVAVKLGSTGDSYAQKNLTNAKITELADESACVTEVAQGKADAFIYDQLTVYRDQQANPDTTQAVFIPFQSAESWGVGIKKGNTSLLNSVNAFIDQFYADHGFDALTTKYLSAEKQAFDQLGFPWFFDGVDDAATGSTPSSATTPA